VVFKTISEFNFVDGSDGNLKASARDQNLQSKQFLTAYLELTPGRQKPKSQQLKVRNHKSIDSKIDRFRKSSKAENFMQESQTINGSVSFHTLPTKKRSSSLNLHRGAQHKREVEAKPNTISPERPYNDMLQTPFLF
jgi:hypothetical protein